MEPVPRSVRSAASSRTAAAAAMPNRITASASFGLTRIRSGRRRRELAGRVRRIAVASPVAWPARAVSMAITSSRSAISWASSA